MTTSKQETEKTSVKPYEPTEREKAGVSEVRDRRSTKHRMPKVKLEMGDRTELKTFRQGLDNAAKNLAKLSGTPPAPRHKLKVIRGGTL